MPIVTSQEASPLKGDADLRNVQKAHKPFPLGRAAAWRVILLIAGNFGYVVSQNANFGWPVVATWFFEPTIMDAVVVTLSLAAVSMVLGIILGLALAVARLSKDLL